MARLIKDAAKLDNSIDANDMSFGNIVKSINAVQKEMGIYGTTSKEASSTISGSLASVKAQWNNLLTAISQGDDWDLGVYISNLVDTVSTAFNNLMPVIQKSLVGIAELISQLAPIIVEKLPEVVNDVVPALISGATSMVNSVIAVLPDLLNTVVDALIQNAPALITAAIGLVQSLIQGIQDNYQILVDGAFQIVTQLATGILNMLPQIVQLGLDLIVSLANGITASLPTLLPTIVDVILQIVDTLTSPEQLTTILNAALTLITELSYGLMDAIPQLVDACLAIIENLVDFLIDPTNIGMILKAALDIIIALGTGIINSIPRLIEYWKKVPKTIVENFKETNWSELGKNIIDGILGGLKRSWESLDKWVSDAWNNLVGGIGDFFGGIFGGDSASFSIDGSHRNGLDYVPYDGYIAELHKGERVLTASEASGYGGTSIGNITINIDGAKYSDEQSLASAIALEIQNMTDRRAAVYA